MATIELTTQQVIDLVRQLPAERKREVLLALAGEVPTGQGERMKLAAAQIRKLCAQRGLNWDAMNEESREQFVDDLIHEDRTCDES